MRKMNLSLICDHAVSDLCLISLVDHVVVRSLRSLSLDHQLRDDIEGDLPRMSVVELLVFEVELLLYVAQPLLSLHLTAHHACVVGYSLCLPSSQHIQYLSRARVISSLAFDRIFVLQDL